MAVMLHLLPYNQKKSIDVDWHHFRDDLVVLFS